jgi:hypothetical protein
LEVETIWISDGRVGEVMEVMGCLVIEGVYVRDVGVGVDG